LTHETGLRSAALFGGGTPWPTGINVSTPFTADLDAMEKGHGPHLLLSPATGQERIVFTPRTEDLVQMEQGHTRETFCHENKGAEETPTNGSTGT